jgi:hypothetical protein
MQNGYMEDNWGDSVIRESSSGRVGGGLRKDGAVVEWTRVLHGAAVTRGPEHRKLMNLYS